MTNKSMMRSTGVIGIATVISRVLGFLRDIIFAGFFGTSIVAQAFIVAFRIPNMFRDFVGEGAMNSAIVPVLSEYKKLRDEKEFLRSARVLFNISLMTLSLLTVAGMIFSPQIVKMIAPGFINEPEKFALTVFLNRYMFPYLVFIGLTAYCMGVLNSLKHFAVPALGSSVMNVMLIISVVWFYPAMGPAGFVLGVLAGGFLQLVINMPVMYKHGFSIDFRVGLRDPAVDRITRLLIPRALGSAIYQINIFVDTILASLAFIVGAGGVAALYYANRLIQFPMAIFAIALSQAALPKMSAEFASNNIDKMKETISFSLRHIFFVMVPSGFALAVLGELIVKILFQRGEFGHYSTSITAGALFFYSFALFAYGGIKLLTSAFYSMHDTKTPVKTACIAVIVNVILNVILMFPMRLNGLALATSISAAVNFIILYGALKKRIGDFDTLAIRRSFIKLIAAGAFMAFMIKFFLNFNTEKNIFTLIAAIFTGVITFFLGCYLVRLKELEDIFIWISKRR